MEIGKLTATTRGQSIRFDLFPGQALTLGRSSRCTIKVPDPKMSREHCRLEFVNGKLTVSDLDSSHGLTYRGLSTKRFEIEVGDGFHVGQTFVRFEALEQAAAGAMPPEPRRSAVVDRDEPRAVRTASAAPAPPEERDDVEDLEDVEDVDEVEVDEMVDDEPEWEPEEEYPTVSTGRPSGVRRGPRRTRGSGGGGLLFQLVSQLVLYAMILITGAAVLLALKHKNPEWDIYRLLDWLRPQR